MATTRATKQPNIYWQKHALEHLIIDEDKHGTYCDVISESDTQKTYRVHVDEMTTVPNPVHCTCEAFAYSKRACKHIALVAQFYHRIYKSNVAKFHAKQKVARIVKIETEVEAVKAETAAHNTPENSDKACEDFRNTKVLKVGIKGSADLAYKGNLNVSQAFVRPSQIAAQAS